MAQAGKEGMVYVKAHPDYMYFGNGRKKIDEYPVNYYIEFLNYIQKNYKDHYWNVLPKELAKYWRNNY